MLIGAQNRTLDMIQLLARAGQNTDAALSYLASWSFSAYNQLSANVSHLFALANATNAATLVLYNSLLQVIDNDIAVQFATSGAIDGLQDLRLADKSELQA